MKGVIANCGSLKIDLADKIGALDKLCRMLGLFSRRCATLTNVTVNQVNVGGEQNALEAARRLASPLPPPSQQRSNLPEICRRSSRWLSTPSRSHKPVASE
jgi:hypothetical protein